MPLCDNVCLSDGYICQQTQKVDPLKNSVSGLQEQYLTIQEKMNHLFPLVLLTTEALHNYISFNMKQHFKGYGLIQKGKNFVNYKLEDNLTFV